MSFLHGMTDTAIGPVVQRNNGSVGRAKTKALEQLKEYMREAAGQQPDARECVVVSTLARLSVFFVARSSRRHHNDSCSYCSGQVQS
jgi:hypothetical protein